MCWPSGEPKSTECYSTSQELYDHWKVEHSDDAVCERPYRCGLPECGKGWKVCVIIPCDRARGLMFFCVYRVSTVFSTICSCKTPFLQHLEIMLSVSASSKAHFQKAISASITTQPDASIVDTIDVSAGTKKKTFACPRPGCTNHYKQMSGLRYHLTHVSNTDICLVRYSRLTFISRAIINSYHIS